MSVTEGLRLEQRVKPIPQLRRLLRPSGGGEVRLTRRQGARSRTEADIRSVNATGSPSPVPPGAAASSGHGQVCDVRKRIWWCRHTKCRSTSKYNVVTTIAARELDEHEGIDEAGLREHEEVTKVKNVSSIEMGQYRMETWYFSPLPKELLASCGGIIDILYVCEFTLNFFTRKEELLRFQAKERPRNRRHPPGNEIYRKGNLSMFEVDGLQERIYCQNLCYIAKDVS